MKNYAPLQLLFSDFLRSTTSEIDLKSPPELYQPCSYILSLGGKRVRPLLALVACDLFDQNPANALNAALSVELFHNFSLVHDDILDEAPLRRNQATVHLKWNRNIAILSGDALLVKSLHVLQHYPPSIAASLSDLMCSTALEVCEGQQMDMNFEAQPAVAIDDYIRMIRYKTAVLLGASLKMGAITASADATQQEHLYTFGVNLGIAFQLLDDLLDAFAENSQNFGKRPGGDILSNKKTFLLLKSLELSSAAQKQEIERLLALPASAADEKISRMLDVYRALNIKSLCEKEADHYTNLALTSLKALNVNEKKKEHLQAFALHLLNRQV